MMRSNPTATPAASSTVAATPQTQDGTRKLVAQLRASERDAAKARAELRALKTTQQALVAQAEAKAALMEQQMKKNNAKAQQTAKQWKGEVDNATFLNFEFF
jgi:ribosomal protein L3